MKLEGQFPNLESTLPQSNSGKPVRRKGLQLKLSSDTRVPSAKLTVLRTPIGKNVISL